MANNKMNASPETIWRVPVYLPYLQPDLTPQIVAEAEQQLGVQLPKAFIDVLSAQNGGYIRYSLPESVHEQIYGIGPHFPSLTNFDWDDVKNSVGFKLDGLIPFDGDGHWHLCLDYRNNPKQPSISFIDIECNEEEEIAESFEEYLSLLSIEIEDRDFVLSQVEDIDQVLENLSSEMEITFEPPNSWAHGYPQRRARDRTDPNPQWIWISPNSVPRGFVREDDARYEELRNQLPGMVKRYPALSNSCYLMTVTHTLRDRVIAACRAHSIEIVPHLEL